MNPKKRRDNFLVEILRGERERGNAPLARHDAKRRALVDARLLSGPLRVGADLAELFGGFGGFCRRLARGEELEQPAILRASVLVEQAEHDLAELGAGIFGSVFER